MAEQPEHDVDHLADLIHAETRVRVGTVTGRLVGFRSSRTLDVVDDEGQPFAMPWGADLLEIEPIDKGKLEAARQRLADEHTIALEAKRTVAARPNYLELSQDEVAEAVRHEIERGTVRP